MVALSRQRIVTASGLCAVSLFAGTAAAQSVNYGQLEELFGEPVTTSVTGTPHRVSEVPATVEIITADQIRRSGARDIPGVLRHVSGVDLLQWGNDNADASLRGYNQAGSPRTLVLIDGRQVYADFYGFTPWSALPVELAGIRQIEIVKGPNSALFGFNALGGVINIVTWHPYHDDVDSVSVTTGTQGLVQGSLVANARLGASGAVRIIAGGHSDNDFSSPQIPQDVGTRLGNERAEINLQGFWAFSEAKELVLKYSRSQASQPEYVAINSTLYDRLNTESMQGMFTAETRAGLIEARIYSNLIQSTSDTLPGGRLILRNRVTVAHLQDLLKPALNHTLRFAIEYRHNKMDTAPTPGGQVFYDVASASGMWDWHLTPRLSLTNALRLDHLMLGRKGTIPPGLGYTSEQWNGRSETEPSFNSAVTWVPTDLDTLRFTVARGVQSPSLFALGGALYSIPGPGFALYATGSPTIESTIGMQYEVAWDRRLPAIGGNLRLSAYYGINEGFVTIAGGVPPSFAVISTSANAGDSSIVGLELAVKSERASGWNWGVAYTPRWVTDDLRPGFSAMLGQIDFANTTPRHMVDAQLGWARSGWELDAFVRYQSRSAGIRGDLTPLAGVLVPIPAYMSLDARVGYALTPRVTLAVAGQNLLHAEQRQTASSAVERRVLGTLSVDF